MEGGHNDAPQLVLYKLHGSINWKRDEVTKELFSVEQIESVDANKMEVIFGREFKLEAADPYLFFAYKFRDLSLSSRLIATLGYGFGDGHINKMLTQSLRDDPERRLLVVQQCTNDGLTPKQDEVIRVLELRPDQRDQIVTVSGSVKEFLSDANLSDRLLAMLPPAKDAPF